MKLHSFFESLRELRTFLLLFTTQALSSLGSAMTSYALVIWAYQQSGSALSTALLVDPSIDVSDVAARWARAMGAPASAKVVGLVRAGR